MGVPAAQMKRTAGGWEAVVRALDSALAEGDFPGGAAVVLTMEVVVVGAVVLLVVVSRVVLLAVEVLEIVVVLVVANSMSATVNVRVGTTLAVWVRQRMASSKVTPTNWVVE